MAMYLLVNLPVQYSKLSTEVILFHQVFNVKMSTILLKNAAHLWLEQCGPNSQHAMYSHGHVISVSNINKQPTSQGHLGELTL